MKFYASKLIPKLCIELIFQIYTFEIELNFDLHISKTKKKLNPMMTKTVIQNYSAIKTLQTEDEK